MDETSATKKKLLNCTYMLLHICIINTHTLMAHESWNKNLNTTRTTHTQQNTCTLMAPNTTNLA